MNWVLFALVFLYFFSKVALSYFWVYTLYYIGFHSFPYLQTRIYGVCTIVCVCMYYSLVALYNDWLIQFCPAIVSTLILNCLPHSCLYSWFEIFVCFHIWFFSQTFLATTVCWWIISRLFNSTWCWTILNQRKKKRKKERKKERRNRSLFIDIYIYIYIRVYIFLDK